MVEVVGQPIGLGIDLDRFTPEAPDPDEEVRLRQKYGLDPNLPVVLHVRKAHDPMLNTLKRFRLPGGFCHAFNGSLVQAGRYLELGFRLGFGGMLTYERSSKLRALARQLPAEAIVLETDAPDMVVSRHRGERNSPEYLPQVLASLAEVRGETLGDLAARTLANTRDVLDLS